MDFHIASTFGLLLGVSLLAGLLAEWMHLPKVTAYLLVGLALGPSALDLIHVDHIHAYEPMLQLAMALVLFALGCQFPMRRIRRLASRGLMLSLGELAFTFIAVTTGLLLIGQSVSVSIVLGALALATAPATTVLVFKEYQSEGPVTEYANFLVALNNLAAIVAFELAMLGVSALSNDGHLSVWFEAVLLARSILGSIVFGVIAGVLMSFLCGLISTGRWLVLLVALTTFVLGWCETLDVPYLLTFLIMGMTVANLSDIASRIVEELDHLTGLLCVLFFTVHGAELDMSAFLALGLVGGVYVICRILGKYWGARIAAVVSDQSVEVQRWLGATLLAQAGAAIALSTIAVHRNPNLGFAVQTVILGSVVVFEIIGPLMIRAAVLNAGEVPIREAIWHRSNTAGGQVSDLWHRISSLTKRGRPAEVSPGELLIQQIMDGPVRGIRQSAGFDEVMSYIEQSHDNTYPIVTPQGLFAGVIRYSALSNVMFDPMVSPLVRAEDLATASTHVLYPDDTAARAQELFSLSPDDCLPVISRETRKLLGLVRRRNLRS